MTPFDDLAPIWMRRLMAEFGLTAIQASGILGNLGYESAGFTKLQEERPAVPGSRGGYGVAQWTGPRRRAFEEWAVSKNLFASSDEANYGFLIEELSGSHKAAITALKKCIRDADAVFSFGQTYERPGGTTATHLPGFEGRLKYAQRALKGAAQVVDAPSTPPADHRVNPPERRAVSIDAAIRVLQGALGVTVDGDFGKLSQAALTAYRTRK